ncbi:hypothetical protein J7355_11125 [Endozoicomonas sp. G2_2]|uniref:hypothetical protein n=1 Tax=Endozoicomonas sp. G2_2 TaxID=2821092 RepID=UPI001AD96F18|nr:hypothetical protein [Endozoicomonas sp. G2_2]MBO9470652.1 hypothetical protein [Endozoicomonas sp. G2_2]
MNLEDDEVAKADLSKLLDHFPADGERDLQILKGHLLIEDWLREIFQFQLSFPEAVNGPNGTSFQCHQLICLVEGLTPFSQGMPWVWVAAKKLNKLRNDLAHNLSSKGLEDRVSDFVNYVIQNGGKPQSLSEDVAKFANHELVAAMVTMCAAMASMKQVLLESHRK